MLIIGVRPKPEYAMNSMKPRPPSNRTVVHFEVPFTYNMSRRTLKKIEYVRINVSAKKYRAGTT